jgi:hypothetical protein
MAKVAALPTTRQRQIIQTSRWLWAKSFNALRRFLRRFLRLWKNGAKYVLGPAGRTLITCALFGGTGDIQAVLWPVSPACSDASSATARDTRSRSKTAAINPHTTATTKAIQENRVSQRSAATPA